MSHLVSGEGLDFKIFTAKPSVKLGIFFEVYKK